jgi:hypothetical protein
MSLQDFAALITGIVTGLAGVATMVHMLVKHYLSELKPNGGSSMRDAINDTKQQITVLEARVETIIDLLKK